MKKEIEELKLRIEESKRENEEEIARANLALKENRKFESEWTMEELNTRQKLLEDMLDVKKFYDKENGGNK